MFDKMKQLMDMQKKMQEVKRELDNANFDISSSSGLVKITMNGSQEVKAVSIQPDLGNVDKPALEDSIKEAYNKGIKRSQDLAAQKMRSIAGFNLPGLT